MRNLSRKNTVLTAWRERKNNKYREEQTGQSRLSIPRYNCVVILYTKYELSVLYSCEDIFDEKCGEKEKRTYTRKNKQEKTGSQPHDATCLCLHVYQI